MCASPINPMKPIVFNIEQDQNNKGARSLLKDAQDLEKKGEKERAALTYVDLADLQKAEGMQDEAIATLKKSLELFANSSVKEKLGNILCDNGQKQDSARVFLELAQEALDNKNQPEARTFCDLALNAFPGHAEIWKTMADMQQEPSEQIKTLLKGANVATMPTKERIGLCNIVLLIEPAQQEAKLLYSKLTKDKTKQLNNKPVESQLNVAENSKKSNYKGYDTYHDGHGWKHVIDGEAYKQNFKTKKEFADCTKGEGNAAKFFPEFREEYETHVKSCVESWVDKGANENHRYVEFLEVVGADNGKLTKTVEIYFTISGGAHIRPSTARGSKC